MRQRDLISAIEMLLDSTEALDRLHKIPAREIDQLIELLSTQSGVRSLRRLLETIRSSPRGSRARAPEPQKPALFDSGDDINLGKLLDRIFADKRRFPTVASIAEFVHKTFGLRIDYAKHGRARYIGKVVKKIAASPSAMARVRKRLINSGPSEQDQAYKQLYDYIRGRHRNGNDGSSS